MTISVTQFKRICLEVIRSVESNGQPVEIVRRGRVVARLVPAAPLARADTKPWQRLRGAGSVVYESVLRDSDSDALK